MQRLRGERWETLPWSPPVCNDVLLTLKRTEVSEFKLDPALPNGTYRLTWTDQNRYLLTSDRFDVTK